MQRLALAIVAVALLVLAVAFLAEVARRTFAGAAATPSGQEARPMQSIAFALLVALIFYVAFAGSS